MVWKSLITGLAVPALLAVPAPASAAPQYSPTGMVMYEIFTATNRAREAAGCAPLRADTDLILASVQQSRYMAVTRTFSHVGAGGSSYVTRARAEGYRQPAGENIAWGFQDPADVVDTWLASPPHRANILNCDARSIGTGVRYAADGTPYYTQVFGWE
jgi:uncharacterized protein YkwD